MADNSANQTSASADHPGVIMRPPLLFLSALILTALLELALRLRAWPESWSADVRYILAILIGVFGITLMRAAMRRFSAAGTNVPTYLPAKALVRVGPYRISRNPIYVALFSIYLALVLGFDSLWGLIILVPLFLIMRFGVVAREERYLSAKFGAAYDEYRRAVRRWI